MAMSIEDDCGATAAALEARSRSRRADKVRARRWSPALLHSAACASGRGYEEESGYWGEERLMALVTHACGENGLERRRGGNK